MQGFTTHALVSVNKLVVPNILIGGSIVGKLVVLIILFDGSAASIVSTEILFDDIIVSTIKVVFDRMVMFSTPIGTSLAGPLPPFSEEEA